MRTVRSTCAISWGRSITVMGKDRDLANVEGERITSTTRTNLEAMLLVS